MALLEDALIQYDELEAAFFQVIKERGLAWFGHLVDPEKLDDASPILDLSAKPYKELILANKIAILDLRTYLLAHQANLLARQGRLIDVAMKVHSFLATFSRSLRETEVATLLCKVYSCFTVFCRPYYHGSSSSHGRSQLLQVLSINAMSGMNPQSYMKVHQLRSVLQKLSCWNLLAIRSSLLHVHAFA